jgi:glycerate kinase
MRAALNAGARRIILGLGGSATNDGGAGMAQALGALLADDNWLELEPGGIALNRLRYIETEDLDRFLEERPILAATDVRNPLLGPEGATHIYGPQKGASPEDIEKLERALQNYADVIEENLGVRVHDIPGAGAAGGLGAGLIAFCHAELRPGFDVIAETVRLRECIQGADLVITGEGRMDAQTQYGKTVVGVAEMAAREGVAVIAVPGARGEGWEAIAGLFEEVEPVGRSKKPVQALARAVERVLRRRQPGRTA